MRRPRLRSMLGAAIAIVLSTASAGAQQRTPTPADAAAAEALFNEGKRLMASGDHATACPKFAESQRLDPGIGTMLWLGECHAKNRQLASAWAIFKEAEALASKTKDPRVRVAREEAKKLEPRLAKLVIDVPETAKVSGLVIERDGVELGSPLWGTPIPTDTGKHRIAARAPKHATWEREITIATDGSETTVRVPVLEAAPEEPAPVAQDASASSPPAEDDDPNRGRGQRIAGIGVGVVGLVGIGLGAFFGLEVKSKNDESNAFCNGNECTQRGVELRNDALDAAMLSNIAFIAGGVALAGGAVLYFTAPKPSSSSARLRVGPVATGAGAFLATTF